MRRLKRTAERRNGLSDMKVIALVLLASVVGCVVFSLHLRQVVRDSARRLMCANHLENIGMALHNYRMAEGCLPPAYVADENGRPMHSWRTLILQSMELQMQYDFNEPWDSPENRQATESRPPIYRCLKASRYSQETNYVMIVGPDAVCQGATSRSLEDIDAGQSVTAIIIEVVDSGIHWAEPRDISVDDLRRGINAASGFSPGSLHRGGGVHVLMANGAVHSLSDDASADVLVEMAQWSEDKQPSRALREALGKSAR